MFYNKLAKTERFHPQRYNEDSGEGRLKLPNCKQCGTPLFTYVAGDSQEYCPTCQAAIEAQRKQAVSNRQLVRRLPITTALIVINVLVFLVMVLNGVSPFNPAPDQVLHWGAQFGPLTLDGQWWRLFSSMFLHYGLLHLGLNMWCLWNLGLLAESLLGHWTFLAVYLATGIGADLLSLAWDPMRASAGASGAIFGLAGVLITGLYFAKLSVQREQLRGILRSVVVFAVLNLAIGLGLKIVDNMAHLGGLVTGLAIGLAMASILSRPREQRAPRKLAVVTVASLALAAGVILVKHEQAYAVFFGRGEDLIEQQNYPAAITQLKQAASLKPKNARIYQMLGFAYLLNQDKSNARISFQNAVQLDPNLKFAQERLQELNRGQ